MSLQEIFLDVHILRSNFTKEDLTDGHPWNLIHPSLDTQVSLEPTPVRKLVGHSVTLSDLQSLVSGEK